MTITTLIGYLAAVGTTVSFIPQAIETIKTKDTKGISFSMYFIFTLGTVLWLVYGIILDSPPIYVANAVTLVFASIILVYKLKYK